MVKKKNLLILVPIILAFMLWFLHLKLFYTSFLVFSDTAKFADVARNFALGNGFSTGFSNFGIGKVLEEAGLFFSARGILPFYPLVIAFFFKLFGVSDAIVIWTSGMFYTLSALVIYLLGKKIFGQLVGILAALAFIFDPAMLTYATSGASESLFIFELILAALLFYTNNKKTVFFGFLTLVALYFTRPSAIIYIAGLILLFILLSFKKRPQIFKAVGIAVFIWLIIEMVLIKLSGRFFPYSPLRSFLYGTAKFSPLSASTETLRGGMAAVGFQLKPFITKFFYNLYNFYKLLPQILSPYLAGFYLLSLFRWEEAREKKIFRGLVLFFVLATFFAAAATLPIYRYLHPIIPFVYLLAVEMLVWIAREISKSEFLNSKQIQIFKSQNSKIVIIATSLIFVFVAGQTLGKIFLDSRYLQAHTNQDKPPVYVKLAWLLKENTKPDDLIITNLDTWGSWYGQRRTIWYPLEPSQLIPPSGKELKVDAIYLTSYKIDDENYYMGGSWRKMFYNPEKLEDKFFADNFEIAGKFEIKAEETYEKEAAVAVLLKRK